MLNNTSFQVRAAEERDADNLAALSIQVWLHTYAWHGIDSKISRYVLAEYTSENMARKIANPNGRILLVEKSDHLLGYAALLFDSPCPTMPDLNNELASLYIQTRFAGQGLGGQLLAASAAVFLQRSGNSKYWLTVNEKNQQARDFYQKHGFCEIGDDWFEMEGERFLNKILLA